MDAQAISRCHGNLEGKGRGRAPSQVPAERWRCARICPFVAVDAAFRYEAYLRVVHTVRTTDAAIRFVASADHTPRDLERDSAFCCEIVCEEPTASNGRADERAEYSDRNHRPGIRRGIRAHIRVSCDDQQPTTHCAASADSNGIRIDDN